MSKLKQDPPKMPRTWTHFFRKVVNSLRTRASSSLGPFLLWSFLRFHLFLSCIRLAVDELCRLNKNWKNLTALTLAPFETNPFLRIVFPLTPCQIILRDPKFKDWPLMQNEIFFVQRLLTICYFPFGEIWKSGKSIDELIFVLLKRAGRFMQCVQLT